MATCTSPVELEQEDPSSNPFPAQEANWVDVGSFLFLSLLNGAVKPKWQEEASKHLSGLLRRSRVPRGFVGASVSRESIALNTHSWASRGGGPFLLCPAHRGVSMGNRI